MFLEVSISERYNILQMEKYKYLAPKYYEKFQCKTSRCRKTCCTSWRIPISRSEYNKLITMDCSPELNDRVQRSFIMPENVTEERFRYISFNYLGLCPLQKNGLCDLHKEKGEGYLPTVCKLYPRSLKNINGINFASCSASCERVVELLMEDDIKIQETELSQKPQLKYEVSEDDQKQINQFNKIIKDRSTTLSQSLIDICQIINREEFDKDYASNVDPIKVAIDLLERLSENDETFLEKIKSVKTKYYNKQNQYYIDKEKAEDKDPQYMLKIERLINNSMMYECFPFVDPRAKRTNVYKGLCFCYGFLMILFVEAISNDSSEEELIDSISSLFRIIDHTAFYYNMSVLYDNAAIMLKL